MKKTFAGILGLVLFWSITANAFVTGQPGGSGKGAYSAQNSSSTQGAKEQGLLERWGNLLKGAFQGPQIPETINGRPNPQHPNNRGLRGDGSKKPGNPNEGPPTSPADAGFRSN